MRRLPALVIALSSLASFACHSVRATRAPDRDPVTDLDALIARIDGLADDPRPGECEQVDAGLAALSGTAVEQKATYARAEATLRCGRPERWQALHEGLARADYMPSLVRLAEDAIEQHEWDRALAIVERIGERDDRPGERERMQRLELQLIHARWVDHGDPADFALLEREIRIAIVRDPKLLEPRAALIRLYVEHATLTGKRDSFILAQVSEREARRIADDLDLHSPALELVRGFIHEFEGDRLAAVAAWTRALELNAALVEPRLWLGLAALERRDFATAREQLRAFVDVHPDHVDALLALGVAARETGDLAEAERIHQRIVALDPDDPRPHWTRAVANEPERFPEADERQLGDLLWVYRNSLASFVELYPRAGRRVAALEQTYEQALERLVVIDEYMQGYWSCSPPFTIADQAAALDALERRQDDERREKLEALEQAAAEAEQP